MTVGLPVSRLIQVTVNLAPALARFPNFNTCLVLTNNDVIDVVTRMAQYASVAEVAAAFGTDGPEYACAVLWFGQSPQPETLLIGRWVETASAGQLFGGALLEANRVVGPWNAINNGAFKVTIDGVGPQEIGNLDFSAAANMNAVAAVIESGFPGGAATCVWDADNNRFVITSATTGAASVISFLTAPDLGTDISAMMMGLVTSDGAYVADGLDAETAVEAVTIFDNNFSSQFYGLVIPEADEDSQVAVSAYIEASGTPHLFGVTTQDADTLVADSEDCLAALLAAALPNRTVCQYSSSSAYAIMSLLARMLTTDWDAQNSTITLMFKQEPSVTAEQLTTAQADAVQAKNCNVFVAYNNETAIIQYGQVSSGQYVDSIVGIDWLRATLQTNAYNLLYGAKKVPQTDAGMAQIAGQFEAALSAAVNNGLLAPGTWTAQGVGNVVEGDYLPKGYYIYTPPVALQSAAARAARESVAFQILAKLGGAVHEVNVSVDVQA